MIIELKIDISEFYQNENSGFDEAFKSGVIREAVNQVKKLLETKIDDQINRVVKEQVNKTYCAKISKLVSEQLKTRKLKGKYSNDGEITLEKWIEEEFTRSSGWNSPKDHLDKLAKKFSDEMKNRYDLLFASQIVAKLEGQGLLKEDVAKLLLKG